MGIRQLVDQYMREMEVIYDFYPSKALALKALDNMWASTAAEQAYKKLSDPDAHLNFPVTAAFLKKTT